MPSPKSHTLRQTVAAALARLLVPAALLGIGLGIRPIGAAPLLRVEIQSWTRPQSGWLYVVDPTFTDDPGDSRIWLFNPQDGRVRGTIRAGYDPDIAISPRGDRLYIASTIIDAGRRYRDELTVVDTARGVVISVVPVMRRVQYKVYPWASGMMASRDGRSVYVQTWHGEPSGDTPIGLAVFDSTSGAFLPDEIDLGKCGGGSFVSAPQMNRFVFHCSMSNELRVYRLTSPANATIATTVALPWGKRLFAGATYPDVGVLELIPSPVNNRMTAVGGDGAIYSIDLTSAKVTPTGVVGNKSETVSRLESPAAASSRRLYVGTGPSDSTGLSTEIRGFDTTTWQRVVTIRTSVRFCNAVASQDGSILYALTLKGGSVLAIDSVAGRELRAMRLGRAPALALLAP